MFLTIGLINGLTGAIFYVTWALLIFFFGWTWALTLFLVDTSIVFGVAAWGARRFKLVHVVLRSMPEYWLLQFVNSYYFFKWAILCGVFGRSIGVYRKGH